MILVTHKIIDIYTDRSFAPMNLKKIINIYLFIILLYTLYYILLYLLHINMYISSVSQ